MIRTKGGGWLNTDQIVRVEKSVDNSWWAEMVGGTQIWLHPEFDDRFLVEGSTVAPCQGFAILDVVRLTNPDLATELADQFRVLRTPIVAWSISVLVGGGTVCLPVTPFGSVHQDDVVAILLPDGRVREGDAIFASEEAWYDSVTDDVLEDVEDEVHTSRFKSTSH